MYHYFRQWRWDGTWERIHQRLVKWVRVMDGRQATQGATSLDSQSVKTATPASMEVGYDGGKKVKGRKRHLMVDTLGLVLMVVVTAAHISDPQGARLLFARLAKVPQRTRRLLHIWVDGTLARGGLDEVDNGHLSLGARNHQPFRFDEGVCSIAQALGGRTHLGLAQLVSALVKGL